MKDQANKKNKKKVLLYYLILAACLLVIAAVTVTVIFAVRGSNADLSIDADQKLPDEGNEEPDDGEEDNPTLAETGYCDPMTSLVVANLFELHHNKTLNWYYRHEGLDISGEEGDEVYALQDGVVESLSYETDPNSSIFYGGTITIKHEDGITATYKFINLEDGIARGSQVKRGQLLGTLCKATGTEAYLGPHLHLEIRENGVLIDPTSILDIIDK